MATRTVAIGKVNGRARVRILQLHRLVEFQDAFDKYLAGDCSVAYVRQRAKKMLAIGLPSFANGKRR